MGDELLRPELSADRLDESVMGGASRTDGLSLRSLPIAAQLYVGAVVVAGASTFVAFFPLSFPRPWLFVALLVWRA